MLHFVIAVHTRTVIANPDESSCVWSDDCYDKTKQMLCSGPWNDAPCKCIFGKCKFTTDVAFRDCSTYKDCDCKHNRDTCFCVAGTCNLRGPWECHQHPGQKYSEDCRNMKKCDGIGCYCNDGACEKFEDNSTAPVDPDESSCVWSDDCYDKTKQMLCSGPWNDAPCKCIFGKCKFTTDVAFRDRCSTYKDCDCKHNRDTCFCVAGTCNLRGPWECHQHPGQKYS